jgi:hypothetical protein
MKTLFQSALRIQTFFQSRHWNFVFIGGLALQRWGEPRLTVDIDVSLLTNFMNEETYIEQIFRILEPRIPDAKSFALSNHVLLARTKSGICVDIAFAGVPLEVQIIKRASFFRFTKDISLLTCSAEDLLVMKSFADRDKDWGDVSGILMRQQGRLDWTYIWRNLKPLCELKENPGILKHLREIRDRLKSERR